MDASAILEFWFGSEPLTRETYDERRQRWFRGPESFDREIRDRFQPWIELAARGEFSHWQNSARSSLALIILLDQFPRNIYRGTAKAFQYDTNALEVTHRLINSGADMELIFYERVFAYLPLEHSEDMAMQKLSVEKYTNLVESAKNESFGEVVVESQRYAQMHYDIVEKFGRFPHRNEILGRVSTADEVNYLESGGETFGQAKKD